MLIVCPNCVTSYLIDPATLGPGGRTVRCARCRRTWFAGTEEKAPALNGCVEGVIAEAEAQTASASVELQYFAAEAASPPFPPASTGDDSGAESEQPIAEPPPAHASHDRAFNESSPEELAPEPHIDAPSLVPPAEHEPLPEGETETETDDFESYAAQRQRLQARRKQSRRSSRWTALVLVLLAVNVAVIGGREEVVRYLPQTAPLFKAIGLPVNLRHLRFENVKIAKDTQDGINVLIVQGEIVSTADNPIAVPRLRFAARDAAGQEVYNWTALPTRSILSAGEKLAFRSRLASPPAEARTVLVRFSNAHDAASKAK